MGNSEEPDTTDSAAVENREPDSVPIRKKRRFLHNGANRLTAVATAVSVLIPLIVYFAGKDSGTTSAEPSPTTTGQSAGRPTDQSAGPVTTTDVPATFAAPGNTGTLSAGVSTSAQVEPMAVPPTAAQTTTAAPPAVPPPAPSAEAVRFQGPLTFGSYNLDLAQPRNIEAKNVWTLPQHILHGDENYQLAQWLEDALPGRDDCAAYLVHNARRDADSLIVGSRVCGRTPGGRIFRVEVVEIAENTISGQVTVWD